MANVLLVDDDEIEGLGRELALDRAGHDARSVRWSDVTEHLDREVEPSLVLLVVRRDLGSWDRFGALQGTEKLRNTLGSRARISAVVDARDAPNPMLGLRLAQLGVDELIDRDALRSVESMGQLAAGALAGVVPRPPKLELATLRVGQRSDPGRVLGCVAELAAEEPSYLRAFEAGVTQNQSGLSRRQARTLRVKLSGLGDLLPNPAFSSGGLDRDLSLPRWSDMVDFVNLCRGWDPGDERCGLFERRGQAAGSVQTAPLGLVGY